MKSEVYIPGIVTELAKERQSLLNLCVNHVAYCIYPLRSEVVPKEFRPQLYHLCMTERRLQK